MRKEEREGRRKKDMEKGKGVGGRERREMEERRGRERRE
jgi:hypothetical protein